jgi:hypothetical protein
LTIRSKATEGSNSSRSAKESVSPVPSMAIGAKLNVLKFNLALDQLH